MVPPLAQLVVVLLLTLASVSTLTANKCTPTFAAGSGPVYKDTVPVKTKYVCDPHGDWPLSVMDYDSCGGSIPFCFRRKWEKAAPHRLTVSGTVRNSVDCSPVGAVEMELWQSDSQGHYGSVHAGEDDAYCRSRMKAAADGSYMFETDVPGVYGSLAGCGPLGVDLPPYGPAHIHIFVWKPGFAPLITQLYFNNEPAAEFDWRAMLAGTSLGANSSSLQLITSPAGKAGYQKATLDLVLQPDASTKSLSIADVRREYFCRGKKGESIVFCKPALAPLFRWHFILPMLLTPPSLLIYFCCFRRRHIKQKPE